MRELRFFALFMVLVGGLWSCGGGGSAAPIIPQATQQSNSSSASSTNTSSTSNSSTGLGSIGTNAQEQLKLAEAIGKEVFSPSYKDFSEKSDVLKTTISSYCNEPTSDLSAIEAAWKASMTSWQSLQHIQFGPAEESNTRLKIDFYPDANNAVKNNTDQQLDGSNEISGTSIASAPVGAQGLPGLEYLIYGVGGLDDATEGSRRCDFAKAGSQNLSNLSDELSSAWSSSGSFLADFINAGGVFNDGDDVLISILESFANQAEMVSDRKLKDAILSGNREDLESYRSLHSRQNIQANLQALKDIFDDSDSSTYRLKDYLERVHSASTINSQIKNEFDALDSAFDALGDKSLGDVVTGVVTGDLDSIRISFGNLADLAVDAAVASDVNLGFNNQDGD